MSLTIRVLNGDILTYEYNENTTIGDIKKELFNNELKEARKIRMVYQDQLLEDNTTLGDICYTSDKEILACPFPPCKNNNKCSAPVVIRPTNKTICATPPPNANNR